MAEWSFPAIGGRSSVWRRGGDFARLQPQQSLALERGVAADVFRLFRGQDYGLRGVFALDATAKSGVAKAMVGRLGIFVQGRVGRSRWDLTERADNHA